MAKRYTMKLDKDHPFMRDVEKYKATFQKGSQIYRFLRKKWTKQPLYLERTLSYISRTRQRPTRKRETKVNDIAKRLLLKKRENSWESNDKSDSGSEPDSNQASTEAEDYSSDDDPQRGKIVVYYKWICHDEERTTQKTKSKGFICPWCEKDYGSGEILIYHLKCSHPRFDFVLHKPTPSFAHYCIDMSLNLSFDGSYCGFKYPGHDLRQDFKFVIPNQPKHLSPSAQVRVYFRRKTRIFDHQQNRKRDFTSAFSTDNDGEADVDVCSGRLYYHTSTCLPIKPNEVDVDSEADIDPEWLRERTQLMIDEFTDVNEGEKEILKLWNLHIMKNFKYKGDHMMRQACLEFVDLEGHNVIAKNLSKNFTLHLANLFDYGLIGSRDLLECARKLHKLKQPLLSSPPKTAAKVRSERNSERSPHATPAKRACLLNSNCNQ